MVLSAGNPSWERAPAPGPFAIGLPSRLSPGPGGNADPKAIVRQADQPGAVEPNRIQVAGGTLVCLRNSFRRVVGTKAGEHDPLAVRREMWVNAAAVGELLQAGAVRLDQPDRHLLVVARASKGNPGPGGRPRAVRL